MLGLPLRALNGIVLQHRLIAISSLRQGSHHESVSESILAFCLVLAGVFCRVCRLW